MRRQTIGKLQLWIGIVLLMIGIVGGLFLYITLNSFTGASGSTGTDQITRTINLTNEMLTNTIITFSYLFAIIEIILSLLFITQGLANMSTEGQGR